MAKRAGMVGWGASEMSSLAAAFAESHGAHGTVRLRLLVPATRAAMPAPFARRGERGGEDPRTHDLTMCATDGRAASAPSHGIRPLC